MHPTILYSLIGYIQACWVCVILCGRLWATHWGLTENSTARIIRKTSNSKPVNKHLSYYLPSFLPCLLFFLSWKGSNEIRLLSFLNASDWRLQTFLLDWVLLKEHYKVYTHFCFFQSLQWDYLKEFFLFNVLVCNHLFYINMPLHSMKKQRELWLVDLCVSQMFLARLKVWIFVTKLTEAALNCHIWHIFCLKAHLLFMLPSCVVFVRR